MEIKQNFELKSYNTFGVSSKANYCSVISSIKDLSNAIAENKLLKHAFFPLGGGSNLLLTQNVDKWVLINKIKGISIVQENDQDVIVEVNSGENWHEFVMYCLQHNWYGLENLSLIPGQVGASPIQNIGAYGVEVKDFITSVKAIDLVSGEMMELDNAAIHFAYRNSIFKQELKGKVFITSVVFKLHKHVEVNVKYKALIDELETRNVKHPTPKDVSDAVISVRQSKLPDPNEIGNSGSFFKNPVVDKAILIDIEKNHESVPNYPAENGKVKLAAGWLIEKAGWKGFRDGDIGVHEKQALVLVNYGNGTGLAIKQLSDKVIADVDSKFNVKLEREVNII